MKKLLQTTAAVALLSAVIAGSALPSAFAADTAAPAAAASLQSYTLNDSLQVEIKSVLSQRVKGGTLLGAVVRLTNTSGKVTRVPDYEVRLKADDGTEYTLQPSSTNVPSVSAKSSRELSYMLTIDRTDEVNVANIVWVDVDYYVYPKLETVKLDVPTSGVVWQGDETEIRTADAIKKWGDSFTIPSLHSPLVYTPVDIVRDYSGEKPVSIVQMLVENPSKERQALPDLAMDGKSATDVYFGSLVDKTPIILESGEKRYVHFAIEMELDSTELRSLNVLTTEQHVTGDVSQPFRIGRVNILLPAKEVAGVLPAGPKYEFGTPIAFDKLNKLIHPNLEVSLVELHVQENENDGYKTAIAKFKLLNKSDRNLPVPSFGTQLQSGDGYEYVGYAQSNPAKLIVPGAATAVAYSFTVPKSQQIEDLQLSLFDSQTIKPYKSVIAAVHPSIQVEETERVTELNMYPLKVTINDWRAVTNFDLQTGYTYKLKLDLDIEQDEQAIIDASSPKLRLEVVNTSGKLIGVVPELSFAGVNALQDGSNTVSIQGTTEQLETPFTINVYESFTNTNGELAKRLISTLK
ncbi:hypothetical protein ACFFK0_11635 [Paenibacillus chartarius]|uniref:DUF4139 domain-containing protein n=1 Tax=Paenibacillus chartarius TaxID=747481 RepID=A0ABV6DKB5_9BACL